MKILIFVIMVFPAFVWAHYSYEEINKRNPVKTHKIPFVYPEPGSNRHGLLHWCLRPARLPIPPSGPVRSLSADRALKH